jgi:hypothetical protein
MPQENRENRKFEVELTVRIKFDRKRSKIATVSKWIAALTLSVLVKVASHWFVSWLVLWPHLA